MMMIIIMIMHEDDDKDDDDDDDDDIKSISVVHASINFSAHCAGFFVFVLFNFQKNRK